MHDIFHDLGIWIIECVDRVRELSFLDPVLKQIEAHTSSAREITRQ